MKEQWTVRPCRHWWHGPGGWLLASFLAAYVIFMHSTFWTERNQMWTRWQTHWQQEWQAEREQLTVQLNQLANERADAKPIPEYPTPRWGRKR